MQQRVALALANVGLPLKYGSIAHEHDLYALLADAAAQQYDQNALTEYAPLAEKFAARDDHALYQGVVQRAWGVLDFLRGDYAHAETRLQDALARFTALDTRWQMGRAFFELGNVAAAQGNRDGARDYFTRALVEFEALRAQPDVARTRARMNGLPTDMKTDKRISLSNDNGCNPTSRAFGNNGTDSPS